MDTLKIEVKSSDVLNNSLNIAKSSKAISSSGNRRFRKFTRLFHRWIGLFVIFFVFIFSISGIILNHREFFSNFDIPRSILPKDYHYNNWNNAAVKSILHSTQGTFIYGNIGIWLKKNNKFIDFNQGLPNGMDNKNIHSMIETPSKNLLAASLLGLYKYNFNSNKWERIYLPTQEQRIVKFVQKDNKIYALTRCNLFQISEEKNKVKFKKVEVLPPENYQKDVSLFKTLWQLHSGEAFGIIGKLFMDFIALIFIILSITGFIKWYYPKQIKKNKNNKLKLNKLKNTFKFNLRWHNKLGLWFGFFVFSSAITGMFLRPPLLILIGSSKVTQLPFTHLDQINPWYDKFRNFLYDKDLNGWIIATDENLYFVDENFKINPILIDDHPPISVMGVNVLEKHSSGGILVGSFSGLFLWFPEYNIIIDYITKQPTAPIVSSAPPVGNYLVSGYGYDEFNNEFYFDYNSGVFPLNSNNKFPDMTIEILSKSKISLWNTMLEFHTGRIFKAILGNFYILIVPLIGLLIALISLTGYLIWFWIYKGKNI